MKAFKQLIPLLYKDPRHQSWFLAVQAGIWLVPATWGISNQAGTDGEKFHCLRTQCGRSRWSWTWAHSGLEAMRSAWWFWCGFGKAQLWFWLGLPFPRLASPKVCISGFAETTCRLVMLTSASSVRLPGSNSETWGERECTVLVSGHLCWENCPVLFTFAARDTCVQMSWLSHTQLNPMYEV